MFTTTTVLRFDENCALVGQLSWTESSIIFYLLFVLFPDCTVTLQPNRWYIYFLYFYLLFHGCAVKYGAALSA